MSRIAFKYLLFAIVLATLTVPVARAANFEIKCDATPKDYALELVELELSGAALDELSSCMKQNKFKYIFAAHEPTSEGDADEPKYIIEKNAKINISSVEAKDKEFGEYEATYTIEWKDSKTNTTKTVSDKFVFVANPSRDAQMIQGCAIMLQPPANHTVWRHCLK